MKGLRMHERAQQHLSQVYGLQCIMSLMSGDRDLAIPLLTACKQPERDGVIQILSNTTKFVPKSVFDQKMLHEWMTYCYNARFGSVTKSKDNVTNEILMSILKKRASTFVGLLQVKGNLSKRQVGKLLNELRELEENDKPLRTTVNSSIYEITKRIPADIAFDELGFHALELFYPLPWNYLATTPLQVNSISKLFDLPHNYVIPKLSRLLQQRITDSFAYPKPFPGEENDIRLSLVNSSIERGESCIDLIYRFWDDVQIEEFGDLYPWTVVLRLKELCRDMDRMTKAIEMMESGRYAGAGKVIEFVKRVKNDAELLTVISTKLRRQIAATDLMKNSVLGFFKDDKNEFVRAIDFLKKEMFAVLDSDRNSDIQFYAMYMAIVGALQMLTEGKHKGLVVMQKSLNLVKDGEMKNKFLFDLFNLLFIQKNGEYIVDAQLAFHYTMVLMQDIRNPVIRAFSRICCKYCEENCNIMKCVEAYGNFFLEAVEHNSWDLLHEFSKNEKEREIFFVGYQRSISQKDEEFCSNNPLYQAESILADEHKEELDGSKITDPIISSVVKRRHHRSLNLEKRDMSTVHAIVADIDDHKITNVDEILLSGVKESWHVRNFLKSVGPSLMDAKPPVGLALMDAVADGRFNEAVEQANKENISLFELILGSRLVIHASDDAFDHYGKDFPIECAILAHQHKNYDKASLYLNDSGKIFKEFLLRKKKEPISQLDGDFEVLMKQEECDTNSLSNVIFADPENIVTLILNNNKQYRVKQMAYVIAEVGCFAQPQHVCELDVIKAKCIGLSLTGNPIFGTDGTIDESKLSKFDQMLLAAAPEDIKAIAGDLNDRELSQIIAWFPEKFPSIYSVNNRIAGLCPLETRPALYAYKQLPAEVQRFSQFGDSKSIVDYLRSHTDCIRSLKPSAVHILSSDELVDLSSVLFNEILDLRCLKIESVSFIGKFPVVSRRVSHTLYLTVINRLAGMEFASDFELQKAVHFVATMNFTGGDLIRIRLLTEFVDSHPRARYGLSVSLRDFPSEEFLNSCYAYDFVKYCSQLDCDCSRQNTGYAEKCLLFSKLSDARFWMHRATIDETFLRRNILLAKPWSVSFDSISASSNLPISDFRMARVRVTGDSSDLVHYVTAYMHPQTSALRVLSKYGYYEPCLCLFGSSDAENENFKSFIYGAIEAGNIQKLIGFFLECDPELQATGWLWRNYAKYLEENEMTETLFLFEELKLTL